MLQAAFLFIYMCKILKTKCLTTLFLLGSSPSELLDCKVEGMVKQEQGCHPSFHWYFTPHQAYTVGGPPSYMQPTKACIVACRVLDTHTHFACPGKQQNWSSTDPSLCDWWAAFGLVDHKLCTNEGVAPLLEKSMLGLLYAT